MRDTLRSHDRISHFEYIRSGETLCSSRLNITRRRLPSKTQRSNNRMHIRCAQKFSQLTHHHITDAFLCSLNTTSTLEILHQVPHHRQPLHPLPFLQQSRHSNVLHYTGSNVEKPDPLPMCSPIPTPHNLNKHNVASSPLAPQIHLPTPFPTSAVGEGITCRRVC